ncbi:MAG: hypothetical protein FP812_07365 [Desulfobacula sp.]|nr:hypothetical protein [Desulfobacula sp.]
MELSAGNWITIIGIIIATFIGVLQIIKTHKTKKNKIHINQKIGPFSKGDQKVKIINSQIDKNEK